MAKLRFRLDQPHEVPLVGRVVEPDELVEVSDAVWAQHDWPESTWDEVEVPRRMFDPTTHTVADVTAYLEKADDDERERVLALERAGKARVGVLGSDDNSGETP